MLVGVTWVLDQNADPTSALYQRIDTTHIGAAGHSEGAFATTTAGADSHITTIAPICGAMSQKNLHGPAILFCGGLDTTVSCDTMIQPAFAAITNQPAMLADCLAADHQNWVTYGTAAFSPMEVAVVAWMRVQLLGDTALRPMFYGANCTLCQDSAWKISQNSLMNQ
jgi:predicted dienelactone hydrolase